MATIMPPKVGMAMGIMMSVAIPKRARVQAAVRDGTDDREVFVALGHDIFTLQVGTDRTSRRLMLVL